MLNDAATEDCAALAIASHPGRSEPVRIASVTIPDRMRPVAFGGCFGWLHGAAAGSDTAVLLCPGLGRDASTAHRSLRRLADQLAAAGYPTLRFDYPGTGDSCEAGPAESWAAWQQSVGVAADWLRAHTGAQRLVLSGVRIGATLAALCAPARDDVAGLVLLEPVLRGKSFVSQLSIEARIRNPDARAGDGLELDELVLAAETLRLIAEADLRLVKPNPGCAAAIFTQSRSPVLSACEQGWRGAGAQVAIEGLAGLEPLLRPSHLSADEPPADFTVLRSWLRATVPASRTSCLPAEALPDMVALRPAGCIETPLRFGAEAHLFGMLCRPDGDVACDRAVVIGNTGGDPHHGFARFSIEFARRLAFHGIASLRIDFAGLGDSTNPSDDEADDVTHVFEVDRGPDIRAAIDALEALGFRHFTVNGLCSGAYHAFQAGLADERVDSLLLVNLPWFSLRPDKAGPMSFARRSMAQLAHRRARTLLLFAPGDAGLKPVEQHFGPEGSDLRSFPGAVVSVAPGLDHDLTGNAMRRDAAGRMIDFLLRTGP